MITFKQIKDEIMALGMSDADEFDNYKSTVIPAINTAISDLSNIAAKKRRTYSIVHAPEDNVIDSPAEQLFGIYEHDDRDIVFEATEAKAYAFFCSGCATVYIENLTDGQWQTVKSISCTDLSPYTFRLYRGFTDCTGPVRLRFGGEYSYKLKGPALYAHISSPSEEDIQPYEQYVAYDMRKLTSGIEGGEFLLFDDKLPICTCNGYKPFNEYALQSDSVILLPRQARGQYIISYIACPSFISDKTQDSTTVDLPQDAARLIALYAASRAFRGEDSKLADSYREEYEHLKQQLYHDLPVHSAWTSYYGW